MPHFHWFEWFLAGFDAVEKIAEMIGVEMAGLLKRSLRIRDRQMDFVRADDGCLQRFG